MRKPPATPVVLVSMPWAGIRRPHLGLATLSGQLNARGFDCEVLYLSIAFAAAIGQEAYETLANAPGLSAACEHVFALGLFDAQSLDSESFLSLYTTSSGDNPFRQIREHHAAPFVEQAVETILSRNPNVVGFSCTFNQLLASLAVADRLKARRPDIRILFGGGSVHGPMGEALARAFSGIVDHVFLGEADHSLPELLACLADGGDPRSIGGITVEGYATSPRPGSPNLDDVPIPLFDDYFRQLEEHGFPRSVVQGIPFESSRGCWWGEKSHCTFCGLNNEGIAYRSKSASRVLDEVVFLARKYRTTELMAADNILSHRSWKELLPALSGLGLDLNIFYEIRANLGRDDVAALADAGIRWVQPGIETFSTPVLKLMRKGLTGLQNVMLLRLCREFGIKPVYNILVGFPGEKSEDYRAMSQLLGKLAHLPPPSGLASLVQVHRFSPFHEDSGRLGIGPIVPAWSYKHLIPPSILDPESHAYFFDRPNAASDYRDHLAMVNEVVGDWLIAERRIHARLGAGFLEVHDSKHGVFALNSPESALMLAADRPRRRSEILRAVPQDLADPAALDAALRALIDRDWIAAAEGCVVSTVSFEKPRKQRELDDWSSRWLGCAVPNN